MRTRKIVAVLLAVTASAVAVGAFGASAGSAATNGGPAYSGKLVFWFWAESDAPGANAWMAGRIKAYQKLHPKVTIQLVPQATSTLQGAFETAAQSKSGPDLATQWSTLPTLTPAWEGQTVPVSNYVPKSDMKYWLNTSENTFQGKVWAAPLYLLGIPFVWNKTLFHKAGLNPNSPPKTFPQLLSDCSALKKAGVTPFIMGDNEQSVGSWFMSTIALGDFNSVKQVLQLSLGSGSGNATWVSQLGQLYSHKCFNDDIANLPAQQGFNEFAQGKGAMELATDGQVAQAEKVLKKGSIGVAKYPVAGNGKLGSYYDVTQSSNEMITSWSQHKEEAAMFLVWLHTPANQMSWYKATGVFPADSRFPASAVKDPLAKQLLKLDTGPKQFWLENYLPPQVDSNGVRVATQSLLSGGSSVQATADAIARSIKQWQEQQPQQVQQMKKWAATLK